MTDTDTASIDAAYRPGLTRHEAIDAVLDSFFETGGGPRLLSDLRRDLHAILDAATEPSAGVTSEATRIVEPPDNLFVGNARQIWREAAANPSTSTDMTREVYGAKPAKDRPVLFWKGVSEANEGQMLAGILVSPAELAAATTPSVSDEGLRAVVRSLVRKAAQFPAKDAGDHRVHTLQFNEREIERARAALATTSEEPVSGEP